MLGYPDSLVCVCACVCVCVCVCATSVAAGSLRSLAPARAVEFDDVAQLLLGRGIPDDLRDDKGPSDDDEVLAISVAVPVLLLPVLLACLLFHVLRFQRERRARGSSAFSPTLVHSSRTL
ncbi:MAG: hypothetical protein MHM6MM_009608 [Cercozoa sp. M6MM]